MCPSDTSSYHELQDTSCICINESQPLEDFKYMIEFMINILGINDKKY
jgi:hypothetical protein